MKEDHNTAAYISHLKEIWSYNTDNPSRTYEDTLKRLDFSSLLDMVSIGNYFVYSLNLYTGDLEYVSPSIQKILGFTQEEFTLPLYIELIHPDDLPHLVKIQQYVAEFTFENSITERMQFKYCYDYRVKDKSGIYHQLYIQHFYPELSENHNPQRTFSLLTDISHIKMGGTPHLNIFNLDHGLVQILNEKNIRKIQLTNKENEIFEFLVKGFTSQDIADALGISKHTVDTHRRNILKRNNCANTSELLSLYFETKIERK